MELSNDGYLLQYVRQQGIPCLGIEQLIPLLRLLAPKGFQLLRVFGITLAEKLPKANLIVANNVLAHVPDVSFILWQVLNVY